MFQVKQTQLSQFERKVSELDRENIAQAGQIVSIKQELNSLAASNQELLVCIFKHSFFLDTYSKCMQN